MNIARHITIVFYGARRPLVSASPSGGDGPMRDAHVLATSKMAGSP